MPDATMPVRLEIGDGTCEIGTIELPIAVAKPIRLDEGCVVLPISVNESELRYRLASLLRQAAARLDADSPARGLAARENAIAESAEIIARLPEIFVRDGGGRDLAEALFDRGYRRLAELDQADLPRQGSS